MDTPLINEDDLITQALNAHGVFFKKSVRRTIEQIRGIEVVGEEYPIGYMEGASIDLLINFSDKLVQYICPIECKRVYSSEWIFFRDPTGIAKIVYHFSPERLQAKFSTEINPLQEVEICNEGVEVDKRKFSSKNKNDIFKAASPTVIWEAAFQTCKGNLGFVVQEFIQRQKYADELPKAGNIPVIDFSLADSFIFPLLITTAPLPICTDDEAIDLLSGNYKGSMPRKSVPWLILNYPFTPSHNSAREHFSVLFEGYMELKDRAQNYKEGIFILNAAHIIDFFLWFRSAI